MCSPAPFSHVGAEAPAAEDSLQIPVPLLHLLWRDPRSVAEHYCQYVEGDGQGPFEEVTYRLDQGNDVGGAQIDRRWYVQQDVGEPGTIQWASRPRCMSRMVNARVEIPSRPAPTSTIRLAAWMAAQASTSSGAVRSKTVASSLAITAPSCPNDMGTPSGRASTSSCWLPFSQGVAPVHSRGPPLTKCRP